MAQSRNFELLTLGFHGGVGTVTGSRFLLKADKIWSLIDVGMFQGLKAHRELNWKKPTFEPSQINHILLTHAHLDHSGYLPRLAREGYTGPVHCTRATSELTDLILKDSAKLQEEDAAFANKKGFSKHKPAEPLYTVKDAEAAVQLFRVVDYEKWLDLGRGIRVRFHNAGHILGSAFLEIIVDSNGSQKTIIFSGDVGRYDVPLHTDPDPMPPCDILVVESTYGNRIHEKGSIEDQLKEPILKTFKRGGMVLIPAFAVGRSQLVTLILRRMMKSGDLPEVPIHIDSPMAVKATSIYSKHLYDHNLDDDLVDDGRKRLFPDNVQLHVTPDESKQLNQLKGPRIIVSPSGMLTGGRVIHHLGWRLPDPKNLIILVGYQAMGTRGRALQDGAEVLRMHGREIPVRAEFLNLHGLSGHADQKEMMRWIKTSGRAPKEVFVVHGEPDSAAVLAKHIRKAIQAKTHRPRIGDEFDLNSLSTT
ncbi:MAG: MBL fold metallo-hydrolase [Candidatus Eisenbacteria bacterium]|nr:MBL fold metallo-hydrolase [Candidatus Eisenbacteria bacterium]